MLRVCGKVKLAKGKKFVFHRNRAYILIDGIGYQLDVEEASIIDHKIGWKIGKFLDIGSFGA